MHEHAPLIAAGVYVLLIAIEITDKTRFSAHFVRRDDNPVPGPFMGLIMKELV